MNKISFEELKENLKEAKLIFSVLPEMTVLRDDKENFGVLGFAIFKDQKYISWKKENNKYLVTNKVDLTNGYLHHSISPTKIKLSELLKK